MTDEQLNQYIANAPKIVSQLRQAYKKDNPSQTFEEMLVITSLLICAEKRYWRSKCLIMTALCVALMLLH